MNRQISRRAALKILGGIPLCGFLAACVPIQAPLVTPPPAVLSPDDEARIQKIEDFVNIHYDTGFFSGAVLIARDGDILFNKAWGMADRENEIPNTPQTIFVGSPGTELEFAL